MRLQFIIAVGMGIALPVGAQDAQPPKTTDTNRSGIVVHEPSTTSPSPNDEVLERMVQARLEADRLVLSYKLRVGVTNGIAHLYGTVNNPLAKVRATEVAALTPGVMAVTNAVDLVVPLRTEEEILADARAKLLKNPLISLPELKLDFRDRYIVLSGSVSSNYRKRLAERLVLSTPGIWGVENQLQVELRENRLDKEILEEIRSLVEWELDVKRSNVQAAVQKGEVSLSGTVADQAMKERIVKWVRALDGVRGVTALELRVEPIPSARNF